MALVEQIRADRLAEPDDPLDQPETASRARSGPATLPDLLSQLEQLRTLLTSLQQQVQQEISLVERTRQGRA